MKTKEEIINHVKNVGYSKSARKEICAFLIGLGIKEKNEFIKFKVKDDKSFDDFYKWYVTGDEMKYYISNWEDILFSGYNNYSYNPEYIDLCIRGIEEFNVGDNVLFGIKGENNTIHKGIIISLFLDIAPIDSNFYISIKGDDGVKFVGSEDEFDFIVRDGKE